LGRQRGLPRFSAGVEEVETAVLHPIDLPTNITVESAEEREWRIERDTMMRKGEDVGEE